MKYRGLGAENAQLTVYIENTPPIEQYQQLNHIQPLTYQDIVNINQLAGNGWRKVFNVYAKFLFELCPNLLDSFKSWQDFREAALLHQHANHNLLMSLPHERFTRRLSHTNNIHIVAGKGYAERLGIAANCHWINPHFAIDKEKHLIVCPYFDYRQLTNERITPLCQLVRSFQLEYQAITK